MSRQHSTQAGAQRVSPEGPKRTQYCYVAPPFYSLLFIYALKPEIFISDVFKNLPVLSQVPLRLPNMAANSLFFQGSCSETEVFEQLYYPLPLLSFISSSLISVTSGPESSGNSPLIFFT
jgi:hypothetical protein